MDIELVNGAADRFWRSVNRSLGPDSCWAWKGATNHGGYGTFHVKTGTLLAHRVSWAMANQEDPGRLFVCHACDTPSCVNPAHLWTGTATDNGADCAAKWRSTFGERNAMAVLSNEDVLRIRALSRAKWLDREIGLVFGVSGTQVAAAATGSGWSHVPNPVAPRVGQRHPQAKLSDLEVSRIRAACARGEAQAKLARRYGVHQSTISRLARGLRRCSASS